LLRAVLLKVRQTDPTFDSPSILLFSLLRLLKPNLLRKEEALELIDPVLTDLPRFAELTEPLRGVGSPLLLPGGVSNICVSHPECARDTKAIPLNKRS
jgi:hypothetical protein